MVSGVIRHNKLGRHTEVGAVDEAEQIQQGHGRDNVEINLQSKPPLSCRVIAHQGLSISADLWSALGSIASHFAGDALVRGGLATLGGVVE